MEGILSPKIPKKFRCDCCYYYTSNKKDYEKHLLTSKHQKVLDGSNVEVMEVNKIPIYTCECSKTFKTHGGLWKHKKTCDNINTNLVNNDTEPDVKNSNNNATDKDELITYLIKENQEFKNMILEIVKKDSYNQCTTNNNNTNTLSNNNSNNKTFNLNFFLNETCKDAMNMKDFIKSLEMSLPELEKMGELGFAEGMSRVFVDRLNQLDVTQRPILCSEVK